MIGIDTNIVARIIARDDEQQFSRCVALLEEARTGEPLMLNPIVITETVWLLERRFGLDRRNARTLVGDLAASAEMKVPELLLTGNHEDWFTSSHIDFFDVVIARTNLESGCDFTYTFDRRAARDVPGMELLE